MAEPGLVIGTAKPEYVERFLSRPEAAGAALLAPARDRERFGGRAGRVFFFTGTLRWFTPAVLRAFATVRPARVHIVCGLAFDHANVVEAARIASGLLGRPADIRVVVDKAVLPPPPGPDRGPVWLEVPRLFLLAVLAGLIRLARPWRTVRAGALYAHRLGHLALDCEIYLCQRDLGEVPPRCLDVFYPESGQVANAPLLALFARHMHIHPAGRWLREAVELFGMAGRHGLDVTTHQVPFVRDPGCLMQRAPVHLRFTPEEEHRGRAGLARLGLPPDVPHVCLLGRDSLYLREVSGQLGDGDHQWPRNMDINTFGPAALALAERGYAVIRMGSLVAEPLAVRHPLVFDYATSAVRSPFLDIYLAGTCRFFIGAPSGLLHVPMVFRIPCLFVNLVRVGLMHACDPQDITIFKLQRLRAENRLLTMGELVATGRAVRRIEEAAADTSVEYVDNTAEDIRDAAIEMHERLEGTWRETPEDAALQERFRRFFPPDAYNRCWKSPVGAAFLRRHRDLL
jgi:putative glycosyltransferase (TIGR04372 family)